jgi:type II secretion system protein D
VVAELNVQGGAIIAVVRQLEYADASTIVAPLQQFITLQTAQQGNRQPRLSISAETSTNSVLIFGPTSEIKLIDELIDELDTEDLAKFVPQIYVLQHIQATQIASQIQQILTQTSVGLIKPIVVAEPTTNSLIVQAPETDLARVRKLLEDLDRPESGGLEVEVISLKNSSALDLARTIQSPPLSNRGTAFADQGTNSLVITDTPAAIQRVRELVEKLDSEGREIVYRVQRLENTPVSTLQTQLRQFLAHLAQLKGLRSPLTDIITDPVANSVVIYGPSDEAELLTDLLIELDSESLRERHAEVRPLERARAGETATQLNQLLSQIMTGPNAPRIVANDETNSLLIIATPADLVLIDDLIRGLDTDEGGLRQARVYSLKHADSMTLLPTLRGLVGPTAEISAHADSNSIVYTDTAANVDKVFRLIEELDKGSRMEEVVSRVVPLENTDSLSVTTPLQTIVAQVNAFKQRGNKPPVQISPQIDANAVLIVGASEDVDQLARIVLDLDSEAFYEREPAFFVLEWARAEDVAQELTQLFAQTREYGMAPRIVSNEWANALMVMADPRDLETIEKLIDQLDTREGRQRVIKIFPLENAEAYILAPRIQELFTGGTTRTSARPQRYSYGYYGGAPSRAITQGEVSIVADQRLNALIVTAEPQDMEQVAEMIEALDVDAPFSETPRVYYLKNAEAEDLATTLTELFADTDYVQGRYWGMDREVSVSGLSGRVRVMSVPQTNQIIVMASSPRAFEVVEEMIEELDQPSVQAGRTQTIKVKHADVVSLKKTLDELFKPEQDQGRGGQRFLFDYFDYGGGFGGGSSFSNLIGKVRIEADTRTSTLLVVTPELYFPDVKELVARLDVPTKQVLLRVLIAELTRNNERDLGIQWGVDPNTGRVGSIAIDNQELFNFDNDRGDYINPFTDPTDYLTGNNLTDPAQFVSLNSTQFGMVLNFLQTCQDVTIKQSPSITGADNEMATIRVGSETPFISDIDQSAGQVTSSVEYRPLGLTLEVTPHVNSATEVSLLINVTDGDIDPTVPLLLNSAATFTDREVKTRALVQNRHTIVLGGIITEEEREVIDEVPLLNRLPLVGDKFFRNRNNVKETFEILIFITPYILNDGIDSRIVTEMARTRSKDRGLMEIDLESGGWMAEKEEQFRYEHDLRQRELAERRKEETDLEFEEIPVPPTTGDPWSVR